VLARGADDEHQGASSAASSMQPPRKVLARGAASPPCGSSRERVPYRRAIARPVVTLALDSHCRIADNGGEQRKDLSLGGLTMQRPTPNTDPRDRALGLIENGMISAGHMVLMCVKYMSADDVADMLDCNELSERFMEED